MKIAFLTSSLEPAKDGVGDYARLLADECRKQSHSTRLVALHDRHLKNRLAEPPDAVPTLRLSPKLSWPERIAKAQQFISGFDPDWISLQFVAYGFNDRGVVGGLSERLRSLMGRRATQIMFHELWIGDGPGARPRDRLVGAFQRHYVLKLVRSLAPRVVHTSNRAYAHRLHTAGITARQLPLFGSIPVGSSNADDWLLPRLQQAGLGVSRSTRERFWIFGLFGVLHPVWPSEPLCRYLQQAARKTGKQIALVSIGNLGAGDARWRAMVEQYSGQFRLLRLGEQAPARISEFFNSIDFGIATTPYSLLGKSASTAAMLEHGLPVIVNRDDVPGAPGPGGPQNDEPLILRMNSEFEFVQRLAAGVCRGKPAPRLPGVAAQFLNDLSNADPPHGCR